MFQLIWFVIKDIKMDGRLSLLKKKKIVPFSMYDLLLFFFYLIYFSLKKRQRKETMTFQRMWFRLSQTTKTNLQ